MYHTGDPKTLRVLNNIPRQFKKAQELTIQVTLLIFGQRKYSLGNAKSSLETKQKEIHRESVWQIF